MNGKYGITKRLMLTKLGKQLSRFPWDNRFANINVNEQVQLFTQTIINIISNYIPHKTITCDDSKTLHG